MGLLTSHFSHLKARHCKSLYRLSQEKGTCVPKTWIIPPVHGHSDMGVNHVDTNLRRARPPSGAALSFHCLEQELGCPSWMRCSCFRKLIQSNTNYSLIAGTLYISDRGVIHFHVQISACLVYRYWKKLLMEVAHTRAPYFCDMPVAHNHHSPRSVSQMQQL